jgi:hypothetical protein
MTALRPVANRVRRAAADISGRYTPRHDKHFRFVDEFGRDFPSWMENVCLGGFGEQGWAAYAQPGGGRIATGAWGKSLTREQVIAALSQQSPALDGKGE